MELCIQTGAAWRGTQVSLQQTLRLLREDCNKRLDLYLQGRRSNDSHRCCTEMAWLKKCKAWTSPVQHMITDVMRTRQGGPWQGQKSTITHRKDGANTMPGFYQQLSSDEYN
jgi:hypothetical protein